MASERQRQANRRNGTKGGPKTTEGKERTRTNSLKHGLTSATLVVLPEEDPKEYDELLRGFRASFHPASDIEDALVLRLAQAHWRGLRSRSVESGMLKLSAKVQRDLARKFFENCREHLDLHEAIGVSFLDTPPEQWQMYLRYDAALSREFFKTLDTLTRLQRLRQPKANAANSPLPAAAEIHEPPPTLVFTAGAGAQLSDSGIRSVSQTDAGSANTRAAAAEAVQQIVQTKKEENEAKDKKEPKQRPRRTLRSHRPVTHAIADASKRVRRQKRNLRRLPEAARSLPGLRTRTAQANTRQLGRP